MDNDCSDIAAACTIEVAAKPKTTTRRATNKLFFMLYFTSLPWLWFFLVNKPRVSVENPRTMSIVGSGQ